MLEKTLCPGTAAGPKVELENLESDSNVALESTANAYKDIARYYDRYSESGDAPCLVNVRDARYYAGSAMVLLATAAGGDDDKRIKDILDGYGLEHLM